MLIQDHKLAWRWTDQAHAVLPDEVLAQMYPANLSEAQALHKRSMTLLGRDGLRPEFSAAIVCTEEFSSQAGTKWLSQQHPQSDQPVFLSWDQESALRTNWGVFTSYWQEFCYPVSDDLVVFPESEAWVLLYHHKEEFHFGTRAVNT